MNTLMVPFGDGYEDENLRPRHPAEAKLRYMLAARVEITYGDDGELQSNQERPFIDFQRDSVAEIERKLTERGNLLLVRHGIAKAGVHTDAMLLNWLRDGSAQMSEAIRNAAADRIEEYCADAAEAEDALLRCYCATDKSIDDVRSGDTTLSMAAHVIETLSLWLGRIDLMVDRFKRIGALVSPESVAPDSEIADLCRRAIEGAVRKVPLIEQRDRLRSALDALWREGDKTHRLLGAFPDFDQAMDDAQDVLGGRPPFRRGENTR